MKSFFFSEQSKKRNSLTEKYEPIQPFILVEIIEAAGVSTFFDVGANIGAYSFFAMLTPSVKRVHAFEADAETFKELKKNVEMNDLCETIYCENVAVSSSTGTIEFSSAGGLAGTNSVTNTTIHPKEIFTETTVVQARSLDDFYAQEVKGQIIALKIDVEGHEENVIRGAAQLLTQNQCVIQVEVYAKSIGPVTATLESMGFRKIFAASHDYYFTNVSDFHRPERMVSLLEGASRKLIDYNLDRWPATSTPEKALTVEAKIVKDVIDARIEIQHKSLGKDLEYAFYLFANNERVETIWYTDKSSAHFALRDNIKNKILQVTGFVRSKHCPEKMIMKSVSVK